MNFSLKHLDPFLIGIFTVGIFLRFFGFWDWSLTNDELSAINRLDYGSFKELIQEGIWVDGHPALVQIFLFYWAKIFGNSVFAIRLPFVLASIASLFLFYRLAKEMLNQNAAMLALAFLATSQLFVLYGQIARPYSMGLFFTLLFAYSWWHLLQEPKRKYLILFVMGGLFASWCHYIANLTILFIGLFGFLFVNRKNIKAYLTGIGIIILLYIPHLPITFNHMAIGGVGWLPKPDADYLGNFLTFTLNSFKPTIYLIALILLIFIIKSPAFKIKKILIFLAVFFASFYTVYYYSIHKSPITQFSVFIFAFPFLILAFASLIAAESKAILVKVSTVLILGIGLYSLTLKANFYAHQNFANFQGVAEHMYQWNQDLNKAKVITFSNSNSPEYLGYYLDRNESIIEQEMLQFEKPEDIAKARDIIAASDADYVLLAFANVPIPNAVHEYCKQKYAHIVKQERYFNSEAIIYGKKEADRIPIFRSSADDFGQNNKWNVDAQLIQDTVYHRDTTAYAIDKETLYALTYEDNVQNVFQADKKYLTISAFIKSEADANVKLVCSIDRNGENVYWRGTDSRAYFKAGEWYQMIYVLEREVTIKATDQLKIFFWNPDQSALYIDDFKVSLFEDSDYNYYE